MLTLSSSFLFWMQFLLQMMLEGRGGKDEMWHIRVIM
jgi:hypothetical protein